MAVGDAADITATGLRLARRDPSRAVDATEGLEYLNECHQSLLSDGTPWSFLIVRGTMTMPAGVASHLLSAVAAAVGVGAIERILSIALVDRGGRLRALDPEAMESYSDATAGTTRVQGSPVAYSQVGLGSVAPSVVLWPVPESTIEASLVVRLAVPYLAGSDFPLVPRSQARGLLSSYVAARMWDQQAGRDAASESQRHDIRHQGLVRRLIDAYGSGREEVLFADPDITDHSVTSRAVW